MSIHIWILSNILRVQSKILSIPSELLQSLWILNDHLKIPIELLWYHSEIYRITVDFVWLIYNVQAQLRKHSKLLLSYFCEPFWLQSVRFVMRYLIVQETWLKHHSKITGSWRGQDPSSITEFSKAVFSLKKWNLNLNENLLTVFNYPTETQWTYFAFAVSMIAITDSWTLN